MPPARVGSLDRVGQDSQIDTEPTRDALDLARQLQLRGEQRVVQQLHHLGGAERPDGQHRIPIGRHHRRCLLDILGRPAEHHCYVSGGDVVG